MENIGGIYATGIPSRHHKSSKPPYYGEVGAWKHHLSLCKSVDQNNQTAYALSLSLDNTECAKTIAKFHEWKHVSKHEEDVVLYKTFLHNIHFGFGTFSFGSVGKYRFLARPAQSINFFRNHGYSTDKAKWANVDLRSRFFEIVSTKSDQEKLNFYEQAMDANTALGSLYAANKPGECVEFKQHIIKEYNPLKAKIDKAEATDTATERSNASDAGKRRQSRIVEREESSVSSSSFSRKK